MSDFGFRLYAQNGAEAINNLYNSYRILYTGVGTFIKEAYQWDNNTTGYRAVCTISAPPTTNPLTQPLLLLKNNPSNSTEVGGFGSTYDSYGNISSWKVIGGPDYGSTFEYAVAVPEDGTIIGDYGLQILNPSSQIVFDSRRTKNLQIVSSVDLGGLIVDGVKDIGVSFEYYTAPITYHYGYFYPFLSSPGLYGYYAGVLAFRTTNLTTITYSSYLAFKGILIWDLGSVSGAKSSVFFFNTTG